MALFMFKVCSLIFGCFVGPYSSMTFPATKYLVSHADMECLVNGYNQPIPTPFLCLRISKPSLYFAYFRFAHT
jgi:hypothetical protein